MAEKSQKQSSATSQRKRLLRCCDKLAHKADLLREFELEVARRGLVGERRNAKILFLAVISRSFDKPVSVVVKGVRSGGKNTLVAKVLSLFPESAYYPLSGMSEKALARLAVPLKNRFLVITEMAGIKDGGDYHLRTLLSEGHLRHVVPSGNTTRTIEKEGPTGLIMTTTEINLYEDDETRVLSLNITESKKHTRKILNAIGAKFANPLKANARKPNLQWSALLEWISLGNTIVRIPFGESVGDLMANDDPRLTRDANALLGLVSAHALLHRASRKTTGAGVITATYADYKAVRGLVHDILAAGIDLAVSPAERRVVEAVATLTKGGRAASAKQLVDLLKMNKSGVSRHTQAAVEAGYLRNLSEGKQRTAAYVLGDAMPADRQVLPTTTEVKQHYRATLAAKKTAKPKRLVKKN